MKIIERDANNNITKAYFKMKMPLMSDRDQLLSLNLRDLDGEYAGKKLWVMRSYEDPAYPITKGTIRIQVFKGIMIWEDEKGDA